MSLRALRPTPPMVLACLGFACLLAFPSPNLWAQVTTATISGTVEDNTGAVLPSATVRVQNMDTGTMRSIQTDSEGRYRVLQLEPGRYKVEVEAPGFQTAVRTDLRLTIAEEAVLNFSLRVGTVMEQVEVTSAAPVIQSTNSEITGLVDDKKIRDLPLNGRSYEQLATLQTGVVVMSNVENFVNTGFTTKLSVSGARIQSNSFLMDGSSINDFNATPGSQAGTLLGVDTIREFKVFTHNYSAEYGRNAGAVISAVTRSGTNGLHGSVFEFHRNDNLDARNFFDVGSEPPEFIRNQFGFTLGGPIVKDKTFFFGSYEGLRESLGVTKIAFTPNEDARNGFLPDPNNPGALRFVGVAPAIVPYLEFYPLPNGRDLGDGTGEFFFNFDQRTREDFLTARVDHQFSSNDFFFVRYTFDDSEVRKPRPLPSFEENFEGRTHWLTVEEKHIFSPAFLNEFRFSYSRSTPEFTSGPTEAIDEALKFVPGRPFGIISSASVISGSGQFSELGPNLVGDTFYRMEVFQFTDNVSYSAGPHFLRIGADIQKIHTDQNNTGFLGGNYFFFGLENLLQAFSLFAIAVPPGEWHPERFWRQYLLGAYIQDDVKLAPNLTFNVGLRWERLTVPADKNGRNNNLRSLMDSSFTVGKPLFENPSGTGLMPRIGLVWDPFSDGKTAIRAGFGIYRNQILGRDWAMFPSRSLPFNLFEVEIIPSFPDLFGAPPLVSIPLASAIDFRPDTPTMLQYSLNIQRQLDSSTSLSIGYVGSRGQHLSRKVPSNLCIPQILPDGREFFPAACVRANPNFAEIELITYDANSFYNSLQLDVTRRFHRGLQFQLAYTYSKSIDDFSKIEQADGVNESLATGADRKVDRGLSGFDTRHRFVANATYELPFGRGQKWGNDLTGAVDKLVSGWQLNSIITARSGLPFTIDVGFNISQDGKLEQVTDRPNLAPGRSPNPVLGDPEQWFDPLAFELQAPGFRGNLGRNTVTGPDLKTVDFAIVKNTHIGERGRLEFRAEFFNLLNHANFGMPLRGLFNQDGSRAANAGRITNTVTSSRQIQFGLKLTF